MCIFHKKRVTSVIGAGAVLDFNLQDNEKPSTANITKAVREPYIINNKSIDIPNDVYDILETTYGKATNQKINFEMLFHALESYAANANGWDGKCHNPKIYPVFSPLILPTRQFDTKDLLPVLNKFLLRIVEIIKRYDDYFREDRETWYSDFWGTKKVAWDVFNFNYDTTIEHSLKKYEDGFENIQNEPELKRFNPLKLWKNKKLSTVNHLHGCIAYYLRIQNPNADIFGYLSNDIYKYQNADEVTNLMQRTAYSNPTTQDGEEYYACPIITGLRKNDKLNIIPYDFYHGHLYNSLIKNNALLIVGYSFGDIYMNNLIKRMEILHKENKRIVLIDYWSLVNNDEYKIQDKISAYISDPNVSKELFDFLMMMTHTVDLASFVNNLKIIDKDAPMRSKNGNLMLCINGFKAATKYKDEIYKFLES